MDEKKKLTKYTISVYTSNIQNAGIPSSNVFIQIFGKIGKKIYIESQDEYKDTRDTWITKFPLDKSQNSKKFQPGQIDKFEIEETNLGKIKKIRISHDSKSSWHLKKITLNDSNRKIKFDCNKFIRSEIDLTPTKLTSSDDDEEDDESGKENEKNKIKSANKLNQIRYDIKIKTSGFSKQAENFDLKLIGDRDETTRIKLNNQPSDKDKEKFLADSLDFFKLIERNIGILEKICIFCGYNEDKKPTDWFFDYIYIDVPSAHLRFRFDNKSWTQVKEDNDKSRTVLEIFPSEVKKTSKVKMIYKIELYAKKNKHKETLNDNLTVQIFGDFGKSAEIKPIKKQERNADFSLDTFHFHTSHIDLGNISKVKIVQKNSNKSKLNWYLERVQIIHDKEMWSFPYQRWINLDKKDKKKEIKIFEENYRKSRKDFFKQNKYSQTMSTLSHRLLTDDSINDDSYDDSFDDEKSRSRSNSLSKSPTNNTRRRSSSSERLKSNRSFSNESDRSRPREKTSLSSIKSEDKPERFRRRSRTVSIDRNVEDDLEKRYQALNQEMTRQFKEKSPDNADFNKNYQIEDKFKKRYPNFEQEINKDYEKKDKFDYRKTDFKRDDFTKLNDKIKSDQVDKEDYDFDKRYSKFKPDKPESTYDSKFDKYSFNAKKKNDLYNIAEEYENRPTRRGQFGEQNKVSANDLKLDLKRIDDMKVKKTNFNDFENDKELNKIYDDFFNSSTKNSQSFDSSKPKRDALNNSYKKTYY